MSGIAFLIPHAPEVSLIKEYLSAYEDVHVEYFQLNEQTSSVAKLVEQGYEIIVARAGSANRIKKSGLNVTVVELPITTVDVIRAVDAAKGYSPNIAVVGHPSMLAEYGSLLPYLNISFQQYSVDSNDAGLEETILQAARDGAKVIVGGGLIGQAAKLHGLPSVYIESGKEAIMQALREALRLKQAIDAEKVKGRLFSAIVDNVRDGILTVDCDQKLTSVNLRAQQLFNIALATSVGQSIGNYWPGLSLSELFRTQQEELNQIIQIKGHKLICNKIPILVDEKLSGALVIFQEISKIQQAEAHIRKEIYNKGHIAKKTFSDVAGTSSSIMRAVTLAREFASTNSNILIVGETGTGKEVFAQSIHNQSSRRAGAFVAVNCAALPAQILESELFGYVGGAFTGASKDGKPGLFELAHGGTILLDEIAEMDYVNQSRLLRVLQERSVMRLGSDRVIAIDARVIAATNKDLKELVRNHKFREDLYFRLNVLKLELPPLRERPQDIRLLAKYFLDHAASNRKLSFDATALNALEGHRWPGNIRELQNTIERLMAFCRTEIVHAADIAEVLEKWEVSPSKTSFYDEDIQEISEALYNAKGNQTDAAKLLGVDRTTLWRKMRRLGIQVKNGVVERDAWSDDKP